MLCVHSNILYSLNFLLKPFTFFVNTWLNGIISVDIINNTPDKWKNVLSVCIGNTIESIEQTIKNGINSDEFTL